MAEGSPAAVRLGVVVGVDGADPGYAAARWGATLARRQGLPLTLVAVEEGLHGPVLSGYQAGVEVASSTAIAARVLDRSREVAMESGAFRPRQITLDQGGPGQALVELSRRAGLVVVGNRGSNPLIASLGSTAQHVALHAHCPVAVVRAHQEPLPTDPRVVVGVDGFASGRSALELAFRFAAPGGAVEVVRAELLTTADVRGHDPAVYAAQTRAARLPELDTLLGDLPARHPSVQVTRVLAWGKASIVLAERAADADVLVVAPRGLGGFTGLLLGSVTQRLLAIAPVPLAIAHPV
jgi:nucleotide-binding universal stress UspA family protein